MRGMLRKLPIIEQVTVTTTGSEGKAIARHDNMVIFVPFAAPGDLADIQITFKRRNYLEGRIEKLISISPLRTKPMCEHFGVCGGCAWQHLHYNFQLEFKNQQVTDAFQRIGKFEFPNPLPTLGSDEVYYYRNKLEFTFSNRRWLMREEMTAEPPIHRNALGFHMPKMFDKILDINKCMLQPGLSDQIRIAAKSFALEKQIGFHNHHTREGFLRNLLIRNNSRNEWMVLLVVNEPDYKLAEQLLGHLHERFPEIISLQYLVNNRPNDYYSGIAPFVYYGLPYLTEEIDGLVFRIGPLSFFQTNTSQAKKMYREVKKLAQLTGNETVYDLYTGTGTIALYVAREAERVLGFEYAQEALDDAIANTALNSVSNVDFFCGDIVKTLDDKFIQRNKRPDVVITDPPRAGMHEKVVKRIAEMAPERIVYVSCNPATQARDITLLDSFYKVEAVQPVDMFPHTPHIENIVLMLRR